MGNPIIYAFIDSQNLYLGVKAQGWELDFKRFRVYLKEKHRVKKAFLFIGYIPRNWKLYRFFSESGYKLIFKPVIKNKTGKPKGNVDAELVLQAMIEYSNYDQAIIISGDGDFRCLIKYLRRRNKLNHIIVPRREKFSALLREFGQHIIFVNDLRQQCKKNERY